MLLLDTHILFWWLTDDAHLTPEQAAAIQHSENRGELLHVSSISLWELAKLMELGRIHLTSSADVFFEELEQSKFLRFVPISARVALESTRLGASFHKDPADQLIAATARVYGLRLVTADERIREAGVVSVV